MKVFISHSGKDETLAKQLADVLAREGLDVWNPYVAIPPGDNWHLRVGEALAASDLMVILVTPGAMESNSLRHEIEYALSEKKYKGRLLTVMIGPATELPWILHKSPIVRIESGANGFGGVIDEIHSLAH